MKGPLIQVDDANTGHAALDLFADDPSFTVGSTPPPGERGVEVNHRSVGFGAGSAGCVGTVRPWHRVCRIRTPPDRVSVSVLP